MIRTRQSAPPNSRGTGRSTRAFSLLEVMIAMGIFFMAMFSILALVSSNIRTARRLQSSQVDPSMVLGELSLTNRFYEGTDSGDFGDIYPGYEWTRQILQVRSNGLFQVDVAVYNRHSTTPNEQHISVLFYRPDSPAGAAFATPVGGGVQ